MRIVIERILTPLTDLPWRIVDRFTPYPIIVSTALHMHERLQFEQRADQITREVLGAVKSEGGAQ